VFAANGEYRAKSLCAICRLQTRVAQSHPLEPISDRERTVKRHLRLKDEVDFARSDAAWTDDVIMGQFQPINDDHAIEQVAFTVAFERPFNEADLGHFRRRHDLWADSLPAVREPTGFAVQVEDGNAFRIERAPGIEFAFVRPDGSAVWAMRIIGAEIIVECSRYSRWARIWGAAQAHLGHALDIVGEGEAANPMVRASLVVQDAFAAPLLDQKLESLFVRSDLLPSAVFSRGANWHAHSGWFADRDALRILHNLNIDGIGDDAASVARVRVNHIMTAVRSAASADETASERRAWLGEAMESLHLENKALIGVLLQPDLLDRIGMRATQ
jgi:hypothetical protein